MWLGQSMTVADLSFKQRSPYAPARILPDRRRYCRVALTLLGRLMRADKSEFPCKLVIISVTSLSISTAAELATDEPVVVYFDFLGGLQGRVRRQFEGGVTIELEATKKKRERLASQLTWLINRHELDGIDNRRFERVAGHEEPIQITFGEGTQLMARVLDVSISGASISAEKRPEIGTIVHVGKYRSRVARHHNSGFAVEFLDIDTSALLTRHFS